MAAEQHLELEDHMRFFATPSSRLPSLMTGGAVVINEKLIYGRKIGYGAKVGVEHVLRCIQYAAQHNEGWEADVRKAVRSNVRYVAKQWIICCSKCVKKAYSCPNLMWVNVHTNGNVEVVPNFVESHIPHVQRPSVRAVPVNVHVQLPGVQPPFPAAEERVILVNAVATDMHGEVQDAADAEAWVEIDLDDTDDSLLAGGATAEIKFVMSGNFDEPNDQSGAVTQVAEFMNLEGEYEDAHGAQDLAMDLVVEEQVVGDQVVEDQAVGDQVVEDQVVDQVVEDQIAGDQAVDQVVRDQVVRDKVVEDRAVDQVVEVEVVKDQAVDQVVDDQAANQNQASRKRLRMMPSSAGLDKPFFWVEKGSIIVHVRFYVCNAATLERILRNIHNGWGRSGLIDFSLGLVVPRKDAEEFKALLSQKSTTESPRALEILQQGKKSFSTQRAAKWRSMNRFIQDQPVASRGVSSSSSSSLSSSSFDDFIEFLENKHKAVEHGNLNKILKKSVVALLLGFCITLHAIERVATYDSLKSALVDLFVACFTSSFEENYYHPIQQHIPSNLRRHVAFWQINVGMGDLLHNVQSKIYREIANSGNRSGLENMFSTEEAILSTAPDFMEQIMIPHLQSQILSWIEVNSAFVYGKLEADRIERDAKLVGKTKAVRKTDADKYLPASVSIEFGNASFMFDSLRFKYEAWNATRLYSDDERKQFGPNFATTNENAVKVATKALKQGKTSEVKSDAWMLLGMVAKSRNLNFVMSIFELIATAKLAVGNGETSEIKSNAFYFLTNICMHLSEESFLEEVIGFAPTVWLLVKQGETDKIKSNGLDFLTQTAAKFPKMKRLLFETPDLFVTVLLSVEKGETHEIKSNALHFLTEMTNDMTNAMTNDESSYEYLSRLLCEIPRSAFKIYGRINRSSSWAREDNSISRKTPNLTATILLKTPDLITAVLLKIPDLIVTVFLALEKGETQKIKWRALEVLRNIADRSPANQRSLFQTPGLVARLLILVGEYETYVSSAALEVLRLIAELPENQQPLFETPQLVAGAVLVLRSFKTRSMQAIVLRLLGNIALAPENQKPLVETRLLISSVSASIETTPGLAIHAFRLLGSLALTQDSCVQLGRPHEIIASVMRWLDGKNAINVDLKRQALNFLNNLALAVDSRVPMFETVALIDSAIVILERLDDDASLREQLAKLRKITTNAILAFQLLNRIDGAQVNKLPLCQTLRLVAALTKIMQDTDAFSQNAGFEMIHTISTFPEVVALICRTDVVEYQSLLNTLVANMQTKDPYMLGILALANFADEAMMKELQIVDKTLGRVIWLFGLCVENDSWTISEVLPSILTLSKVDAHRSTMFIRKCAYVLNNLVKSTRMARDAKDWASMGIAIESLGWFSFDVEPLTWMKSNVELTKLVDEMIATRSEETAKVKSAAQTLKFNMREEKEKPSSESVLKKIKFDGRRIMISYSWGPMKEHVKLAREIDSYLKQRGFRIWRDENDDAMKGCILDEMADAVSSSHVILVLVSRAYGKSLNCKTELTFARNQRKRTIPILVEPGYDLNSDVSWLGFALSGLLCYDATENLETTLDTMIAKEFGGGGGATTTTEVVVSSELHRDF